MNTIIIPTTQNIELEYPVANVVDRILSGFIDLVVLVLYSWFWLAILLEYQSHARLLDYATDSLYLLALLPAMTYSLWTEMLFQGQTLGKKLLRLRTIRLDGASPGLSEYLLRWIMRLIDIWLSASFFMPGLVGIIAIAAGKKGQRMGDLTAGTSVVKLKLVADFSDTIFMETDQSYEVQFPQIASLSDRDVSILKEVLDAGLRQENSALLNKLADKVKAVTGVESDSDSREFLTTVLRDYNYLYR